MHVIFSSFVLVALSEMGDKTQLLALSLALRFKRPWLILLGILTATLLNHSLASFFGTWISSHLNQNVLGAILGLSFIAFGIWTLKPDSLKKQKYSGYGPYLTTVSLFFLAEMGDKTQLATIALAAKYQSIVLVTLGTTLGMLFTDGLAVFLGKKLAEKIEFKWIRRVAAAVFIIFGLLSFYKVIFEPPEAPKVYASLNLFLS